MVTYIGVWSVAIFIAIVLYTILNYFTHLILYGFFNKNVKK